GENVRDVEVQCRSRSRVIHELIVQRDDPERIELEAPGLDDEDLLDRVKLFAERPSCLFLHIEIRAGSRIDLADFLEATTFVGAFALGTFVRYGLFNGSAFAFGRSFAGLFSRCCFPCILLGPAVSGKDAEGYCHEEPDATFFHRCLFRFPLHTTAAQRVCNYLELLNYSAVQKRRRTISRQNSHNQQASGYALLNSIGLSAE